jgi:hypothetical protein
LLILKLNLGELFMKLFEEFKLYETLWDEDHGAEPSSAFDQAELKACLDRVNASAAEQIANAELGADWASICVKLSEEDLKKALRIGSRGGYTDGSGVTMPAQLIDVVSLEITRSEDVEDGACIICLEISGENETTGETSHEYNNEDIPFVGDTNMPGVPAESDEEFMEYIRTKVFPIADRIAHDIISKTWDEFGFNDYTGITDYNYNAGVAGYDEDDADEDDNWSALLKQADYMLGDLVRASGNADYDDGDGYWQTEYDVWCFRYLYHFRMLNNVAKVEQLCKEYSKKLPNVEFYFSAPEDGDDEVCEIGYTAERQ